MTTSETRIENIHFLEYAIQRIWMAQGASEIHAHYVADAIGFAHRQGKLNQGIGVFECIDLVNQMDLIDMNAVPELVNEGPAFAVYDGKRSSGYYALNLMADKAIELARETGIAIVFGGNHFDAGSFARYVYKAYEQNMVGIASNNTVPLAAPFGGMENILSCPPFDAIMPSGKEPPIWASLKFAEFYDADVAEAVLQNKKMKGKWVIDPESGELTDDVAPFAVPIEGYGRLWDCSAPAAIETPRTYALNMWNEGLSAIVNPLGVPSSELPTIEEFADGTAKHTSVGGSYFMCMDPSKFGPLAAMQARSDAYVSAIKNCKPRPGHRVRIPGETAYISLSKDSVYVEVLTNHWDPIFVTIAGRYDMTEESLRSEFDAIQNQLPAS